MKGPVEPVHRSVPETIQEVIELTGFLCFLFRSTPNINMINRIKLKYSYLQIIYGWMWDRDAKGGRTEGLDHWVFLASPDALEVIVVSYSLTH